MNISRIKNGEIESNVFNALTKFATDKTLITVTHRTA